MRGGLVRLGGESASGISFQSVNWIEILFFPSILGEASVEVDTSTITTTTRAVLISRFSGGGFGRRS